MKKDKDLFGMVKLINLSLCNKSGENKSLSFKISNMKTLITALSALLLLASCNDATHKVTVASLLYSEEDCITTDSLVKGQQVWVSYDLAGNHVAYNMSDKGESIGHTAIVK